MINNIFSKFTHFVYSILAILVPVRFKRLVLLSTLYQKGAEQKIFDHIDMDKLNQSMRIATNCTAIESALSLKDIVWKDVDLNKLISDGGICSLDGERVQVQEAKIIVDQILDKIPSWLRYSKTEMEVDLMHMFSIENVCIK